MPLALVPRNDRWIEGGLTLGVLEFVLTPTDRPQIVIFLSSGSESPNPANIIVNPSPIQTAQNIGVTVHTVFVMGSNPSDPMRLRNIADATGGQLFVTGYGGHVISMRNAIDLARETHVVAGIVNALALDGIIDEIDIQAMLEYIKRYMAIVDRK